MHSIQGIYVLGACKSGTWKNYFQLNFARTHTSILYIKMLLPFDICACMCLVVCFRSLQTCCTWCTASANQGLYNVAILSARFYATLMARSQRETFYCKIAGDKVAAFKQDLSSRATKWLLPPANSHEMHWNSPGHFPQVCYELMVSARVFCMYNLVSQTLAL